MKNKMIFFNVVVDSKNKMLVHNFLSFFRKYLIYNQIILVKCLNKNVRTKTITLLKSPHAHKSSQEHFKSTTFRKCLEITGQKNVKLLFFLKGLSSKMFSSANVRIRQRLNNKSLSRNNFNVIDLNNFNIRLLVHNTIKIKNFQLKTRLNSLKKSLVFTSIFSKKMVLMLSVLQLCCDFQDISLSE